ncbi:MAG: sigma-70 family RNA polymerase sigma factor [bacterium]|nr:sigma-70 family RNA polymerase sigma factor [bacterium]MDY5457642.1 sigma-70 family RNA polymerase sigma factor [Bariatricus sp.]
MSNKERVNIENRISNEELVAEIQAGENGSDNMLQLWQQNREFVYKMARMFSSYAEMDDLMQEGYLGLCEAVRYYDAEKGVPFINYAALWIRQVMQRYIDNSGNVVRIPVHIGALVRKYKKLKSEYIKYYGMEPTDREMSSFLGVSEEKLEDIKKSARMGQIRSLSESLGEEEDYTLADTVASSENLEDDVIRKVDRERMRKGVQEEIERLPKEQAEVIRHRVIERKSLEETGKQIGRYRDAVNMLQRRAMRILTLPDRCGKYRSYYEEYLAPAAVHHVGVKRFQETWTSEVEREVLGW